MYNGFYGKKFVLPKHTLTSETIINSKNLLWMADYDYITARRLYVEGDFFVLQTCNHLQQALEKYLKFARDVIFQEKADQGHNKGNWLETELFLSIPEKSKNVIKKLCNDYISGYRYFSKDFTVELDEFMTVVDEFMTVVDEFVYEYYSFLNQTSILKNLIYHDKLSKFISTNYGKATNMLSYAYYLSIPGLNKQIIKWKNIHYQKTYDMFQTHFQSNNQIGIKINGLSKEITDNYEILQIELKTNAKK